MPSSVRTPANAVSLIVANACGKPRSENHVNTKPATSVTGKPTAKRLSAGAARLVKVDDEHRGHRRQRDAQRTREHFGRDARERPEQCVIDRAERRGQRREAVGEETNQREMPVHHEEQQHREQRVELADDRRGVAVLGIDDARVVEAHAGRDEFAAERDRFEHEPQREADDRADADLHDHDSETRHAQRRDRRIARRERQQDHRQQHDERGANAHRHRGRREDRRRHDETRDAAERPCGTRDPVGDGGEVELHQPTRLGRLSMRCRV
jgi:hypothetical protein